MDERTGGRGDRACPIRPGRTDQRRSARRRSTILEGRIMNPHTNQSEPITDPSRRSPPTARRRTSSTRTEVVGRRRRRRPRSAATHPGETERIRDVRCRSDDYRRRPIRRTRRPDPSNRQLQRRRREQPRRRRSPRAGRGSGLERRREDGVGVRARLLRVRVSLASSAAVRRRSFLRSSPCARRSRRRLLLPSVPPFPFRRRRRRRRGAAPVGAHARPPPPSPLGADSIAASTRSSPRPIRQERPNLRGELVGARAPASSTDRAAFARAAIADLRDVAAAASRARRRVTRLRHRASTTARDDATTVPRGCRRADVRDEASCGSTRKR